MTKKILLCFLCLVLTKQLASQNPIAWYEFANGTLTNTLVGYDFTKTGTASTQETGRDGVANESISLNSDILTTANPTATNTTTRGITIAFWIKTSSLSGNKILVNSSNTQPESIFFDNSSSSRALQSSGYMVKASSQGIQAKLIYEDVFGGIYFADSFTAKVIDDGQWHFIAIRLGVTTDWANQFNNDRKAILTAKVDVDSETSFNSNPNGGGYPIGSNGQINAINPVYTSGNFSLGGLTSANTNVYEGEIDDLIIYDDTIDDSRISTLNNPKRTLTNTAINGIITSVPKSSNNKYINGLDVSLTTTPNANYSFVNWSGDASGNTDPLILNLNADKNITANFSTTASISDAQKINFSIFPNPTSARITVITTFKVKSISIYNLLGKKVKTFKTKSIDISSLTKGIYLLKVETENGKTGIQKIIKE